MTDSNDVVLFETETTDSGRKLGIATLNSERSLNALSLDMIDLLEPQLKRWQSDDSVAAVILQGAGEKAFCAGGDIVAMYKAMQDMPKNTAAPEVINFFTREYQLDHLIRTYSKPILVWGHGFVMGGGIGLMSGASHRVVTEASRLAMPEISIGLYPDVGATYFLSRMPNKLGLFLGLTAAQMNALDAKFCNMADFAANSEDYNDIRGALRSAQWGDDTAANSQLLSDLLIEFERKADLPEAQLQPRKELIEDLMTGESVVSVCEQFANHQSDDKLIQRAQKTLQHGCPLTAHIVWEQIQHGPKLSLEDCFRLELTLSVNCAVTGDFLEGIRALLIDKDKNPQWQHASVADVTTEELDAMFIPPWGEDKPHPLQHLGA